MMMMMMMMMMTIDAPDVLCAQLTRDLFVIANI